jgi:hypothetical protein
MKNALPLTLIIIFFLTAKTDAQIFFHWSRSFDSGDVDSALDVSMDGSGLIHELGIRATGPHDKLMEEVYNSSGTHIALVYGNKHLPGDVVSFIRDASYNTYVLANNSGTFHVVKYDSNLKEKWDKVIPAQLTSVKLGPDGNPVVGGKSGTNFFARKLNSANGNNLWTTIPLIPISENVAFNVDASGNTFLGATNSSGIGDDIAIVKLNSSGTVTTFSIFDVVGLSDEADGFYFDGAGTPYLDSKSNPGTLIGTRYLSKLSAGLVPVWSSAFGAVGGSANTYVTNVLFDVLNNPTVVGTTVSFADVDFPSRVFLHKASAATGATIYHSIPDDPAFSLSIHERALVAMQDALSNIYFGGYSDIGVAPYDKRWLVTKANGITGAQLWTEADGLTDNQVVDLVVTPSLDVYLAISDAGNMDLVKYSQTGPPRMRSPLMAENTNSISVYPNPSSGNFRIKPDGKIISVDIYSVEGKLVAHYNDLQAENTFGENLGKGIYLLRIQTEVSNAELRIVKTQ